MTRSSRRPSLAVALTATTLLIGCGAVEPGTAAGSSAESPGVRLGDESVIVDLTHALSPDMPYWPGPAENPFRHDTLAAHPDGRPIMAAYATPEHHGTHLDAPIHGGPNLASVDELEAADLFGPAVVVDISEASAADADYALTVEDLEVWESAHGRIPDGAIVLARTGWSARWDDPEAYRNRDPDGTMHFPGFSPDAASFLIAEREIRGIGIDAFSVDPGAADGFPVHGTVNGAGKYHLENVARLDRLPATGAWLIVAPIKIEGGSGGQVRIFAILPGQPDRPD